MSVLVKGMEMPKSCPCELLGIGYDLCCSFAGGIPANVKEYYECCQNNTRPSWCPLVPVSPHGRLIDADEIKTAFPCGESARTECVRATIDNAPTVINPPNGGEPRDKTAE